MSALQHFRELAGLTPILMYFESHKPLGFADSKLKSHFISFHLPIRMPRKIPMQVFSNHSNFLGLLRLQAIV